ncbi:MAG: S-layer homology domain-containing protein, partial [Oscillospiraceae bacterium]|nr:S-layer homology domain-containing protein [Oscillospiraceae bacterium]
MKKHFTKPIAYLIAVSILTAAVPYLPPARATAEPMEIKTNNIAASLYHSLVIKKDGSLWAWGGNECGQIGNGANGTNPDNIGSLREQIVTTPYKVMDDAVYVSASVFHSAAIKSDGSLWLWGSNEFGQIGDGSRPAAGNIVNEPFKVMDDVVQVSTARSYTLALKNDGTMWMCGSGSVNWGSGGPARYIEPEMIGENIIAIAAGQDNVYYIKEDNTLWGFGGNQYGTLGYKADTRRAMSDPVKIMDSIADIKSGRFHAAALDKNGDVWAWGDNRDGAAGPGPDRMAEPNKVIGGAKAIGISDYGQSFAIKEDGALWCWGNGAYSNSGSVPKSFKETPKQIMTDVIDASGRTLLCQDGSLWVWGGNYYKRLFNSDRVNFFEGEHVKLMTGVTAAPEAASSANHAGKPSLWAVERVDISIAAGIVPSELQNNYEKPITRLEFAKLAARMIEEYTGMGLQVYVWDTQDKLRKRGEAQMPDVEFTDTDDEAVALLAQLGLVGGVNAEKTLYDPNGTFTREQAATLLSNIGRYLGLKDKSTDITFSDASQFSTYSVTG